MSLRTEKVASTIKKILVEPIDELAKEYNAGLVTVTSVRLSSDLQLAKVYISIYGSKISEGKFLALLDDNKGKIRKHLGKNIRLRHTPDLKFFLDDTLEEIEHIQKLLDEANKKSTNVKFNPDDYDESILDK